MAKMDMERFASKLFIQVSYIQYKLSRLAIHVSAYIIISNIMPCVCVLWLSFSLSFSMWEKDLINKVESKGGTVSGQLAPHIEPSPLV